MLFFASGWPRCDAFQFLENRLCDARLLSVHGKYLAQSKRYFDYIRAGKSSLKSWLELTPDSYEKLENRDTRFRKKYDESHFNCLDVLQRLDSHTAERPTHPTSLMLDSGAFTAWATGHPTTLDEVSRSYEDCLKSSENLFSDVFLINLDVIPGRSGEEPSTDQVVLAMEQSLENYDKLTSRFGNRVLPVFHQGEPDSHLQALLSQCAETSRYLCLSPRNDLQETVRVEWAKGATKKVPTHIKTHGLATMGVAMSRDVLWTSGDSSAWIQNSGFGMVDIYFSAQETLRHRDLFLSFRIGDAKQPLSSAERTVIENKVAELGVSFEECALDYRVRDMVNLSNRAKFMRKAAGSRVVNQQELF